MWMIPLLAICAVGAIFVRSWVRRSRTLQIMIDEDGLLGHLLRAKRVTEVDRRKLTRKELCKKGRNYHHRYAGDCSFTSSFVYNEWYVVGLGGVSTRIRPTTYYMSPEAGSYSHQTPGVPVGDFLAALDENERKRIVCLVLVDRDDNAMFRPWVQATIFEMPPDAKELTTWLKEGDYVKAAEEVSEATLA